MNNNSLYAKKIANSDLSKISRVLCQSPNVDFSWDDELKFSSKIIDKIYEIFLPYREQLNNNYFSIIFITNKFVSSEKMLFIDATAPAGEIKYHLDNHLVTQIKKHRRYMEELNNLANEFKKAPAEKVQQKPKNTEPEIIHEKIDTTDPFFLADALRYMQLTGLGKGTAIKMKFLGGNRNSTLSDLQKKFREYIKYLHPDKKNEPDSNELSSFLNGLWEDIQADKSIKNL
jgi:hypothetical protein